MFEKSEEQTLLWQHSLIINALKIMSFSNEKISNSNIQNSHDTGELHHFNGCLCITFMDLQLAQVVRM
jgi:hypothetical protein